MTDDEQGIREAFRRQREEESLQAPSFERSIRARASSEPQSTRARITGFRMRYLLAATAGLAAVALTLFIVTRRGSQTIPTDLPGTTWRGPTDFLLETPGRELLGSLPRSGRALRP